MKQPIVRLLLITSALLVPLLTSHLPQAEAASCPPVSCATLADDCAQLSCPVVYFRQTGTCTGSGGGSHNEFLLICGEVCVEAHCYE